MRVANVVPARLPPLLELREPPHLESLIYGGAPWDAAAGSPPSSGSAPPRLVGIHDKYQVAERRYLSEGPSRSSMTPNTLIDTQSWRCPSHSLPDGNQPRQALTPTRAELNQRAVRYAELASDLQVDRTECCAILGSRFDDPLPGLSSLTGSAPLRRRILRPRDEAEPPIALIRTGEPDARLQGCHWPDQSSEDKKARHRRSDRR